MVVHGNGGYAQLVVDDLELYGDFYNYTDNPQYYRLQPQYTIPAYVYQL